MNKIVKNSLILMAITLVAGLCLGFIYQITKDPIAQQQARAKQEAYQAVFPDAAELQEIADEKASLETAAQVLEENGLGAERIEEVLYAVNASGEIAGIVLNVTTTEGYGGDINFSMGIQKDGTLNGIKILSIDETAGLGMKAKEAEFQEQFVGKNVESIVYTKTGASAENEIDAISGATITTNAMTNGVNAGLCFFKSLKEGGILDE
ncbi:MAG: RnfABCDGE type electron transport complex subunit G [Candidatus Limivivens sp.]|nr:RnfABCDGE type electron transport complex subunit G [Candidatus Limivivens sp.]